MKLVQTNLAAIFPIFEESDNFLDITIAIGLGILAMLAMVLAGGLWLGCKWPNSQDNVNYNAEISSKHPYVCGIMVLAMIAAFMWIPYWYFDGDLPPLN